MSAADLAKLLAKKVDILDTAEDRLTLTVDSATVLAKSGLALASVDTVTVVDTGAKVSSLTASDILALRSRGVDVIDVSDKQLSFSAAQQAALGMLRLSSDDTVSITGTAEADNLLGTCRAAW